MISLPLHTISFLPEIVCTSFEYFDYQVSVNPAGGFFVSPAWGYPLQWGETYEDVFNQTLEQCLNFLDVSREDLEALARR